MNIKDFKVGQTVYVELTGSARIGKIPERCIEEWEITFIGRKYIKAGKRQERWGILNETVFVYEDNYDRFIEKTRYSPDYILYETRQEIEEWHEKSRLFREIKEWFGNSLQKDIPLERLRAIHGILEKGSEM